MGLVQSLVAWSPWRSPGHHGGGACPGRESAKYAQGGGGVLGSDLVSGGAWSLSVPVCDVRVRVTGGLVDANKVVLDDSLLVYTFPQMVSDFWNSGSWMIALLLVAGTAVLPQLKGLFSVVLWAMPMNHRHRGYALTFLLTALLWVRA